MLNNVDDFSIILLPRGLHRPKSGTDYVSSNEKRHSSCYLESILCTIRKVDRVLVLLFANKSSVIMSGLVRLSRKTRRVQRCQMQTVGGMPHARRCAGLRLSSKMSVSRATSLRQRRRDVRQPVWTEPVSGSQRSQFTKEGALIFTDSSLFQGGRLFLPESCTVVLNGGISYWVEAAVFREVSVKSGRPPALNDFKSRWGDPWLLGAGALPS